MNICRCHKQNERKKIAYLTLYLIEKHFNAFANKANPDQAYSVCLWKYDISDPTLKDLPGNFFVLCSNMKVYLYNYL